MPKSPTKSRLRPSRTRKVGPVPAAKARKGVKEATRGAKAGKTGSVSAKAKAPRVRRGDQVIELLQRKDGCTIDELVERTGLLAHTLRAVISVESRKRNLSVERVGIGHYRIAE